MQSWLNVITTHQTRSFYWTRELLLTMSCGVSFENFANTPMLYMYHPFLIILWERSLEEILSSLNLNYMFWGCWLVFFNGGFFILDNMWMFGWSCFSLIVFII